MSKKLRRLERRLKTNFSADGRYVLERFVGSGAQGNCFKLRRVDPRRGQRKNIVVKLFGDPSAGDDGVWADDEVRALQVCRFYFGI